MLSRTMRLSIIGLAVVADATHLVVETAALPNGCGSYSPG